MHYFDFILHQYRPTFWPGPDRAGLGAYANLQSPECIYREDRGEGANGLEGKEVEGEGKETKGGISALYRLKMVGCHSLIGCYCRQRS